MWKMAHILLFFLFFLKVDVTHRRQRREQRL
uniref:Uncharacterized protein n=1 Tax=Anguilla anguilla TaxID=7936 RepID=A0A0E9SXK0_ANGAN